MANRWSLPARRRGGGLLAGALVATVLVVPAPVAAAPAAPAAGEPSAALPAPVVPAPAEPPAAVVAAMRRDLRLDSDQIRVRQTREASAPAVEKSMRATLGKGFGGAWLSRDGVLHIGVTSSRDASLVRAAGATPQAVEYSEGQLDRAKAKLDSRAGSAPRSVYGWHVDLPANRVVITVQPGGVAAGRAFGVDAGIPDEIMQVVAGVHGPQRLLAIDLLGGDPISTDFVGCSSGFAVEGGIVTAGHCRSWSDVVTGPGGLPLGMWQASTFPGHDYGWIETNDIYEPIAMANGLGLVGGSREAVVGSAVCRSGRTTGVRCGWILFKNATVNADGEIIHGLTFTDACAEHGDSGGPFLAGDQAQGVTSTGGGTCADDVHTSTFQPVNAILDNYGLTLKTSSPVPPWWQRAPGDSERATIHTDVNNDGLDDLVAFYDYYNNSAGLWVFLANGAGGFDNPTRVWYSGPGNWDLERVKLVGGDVNGDGRDDVVAFYDLGFAKTKLYVFYANGGGNFTDPVVKWSSAAGSWDVTRTRLVGGDVNADGRDDVTVLYDRGDASMDIWTFIADKNGGFGAPTKQWSSGPGKWNMNMVARLLGSDINGDGRMDVVAFYDYLPGVCSMFVFIANSSGGFGNPTAVWSSGGNWDVGRTRLVSGDANGDRMDDIMAFYDDGDDTVTLWVFLADGRGGVSNPTARWYSGEGNWIYNRTRLVAGEITGDGMTDVIAFFDYGLNGTSVWVFPATGGGGYGKPDVRWSSAAFDWSLASTVQL